MEWKFREGICFFFLGRESERSSGILPLGLLRWHGGKESTANIGDTGDVGFIPGSGRSPGGGNGNLLQYFCLETSVDGGAWQAAVHGAAKSQI